MWHFTIIFCKVFYKPMSESGRLTEAEMNLIFVNWRELIQCNSKMLKYVFVKKEMEQLMDAPICVITKFMWLVYCQGSEDKEETRRRAGSHDRRCPGVRALAHAGLHPLLQLPAERCCSAATENRSGARLQNFSEGNTSHTALLKATE